MDFNRIIERFTGAVRVLNGTIRLDEMVKISGEWDVVVTRANGAIERKTLHNIVVSQGLNRLANRAISATVGTPWYILGVGTISAAASLDSVNFGEVANGRKAAATVVQSSEWFALTMTWAGNADALTGIVLESAAILCHANSGIGAVCNIVNGLSTTLAASDFLNLTARVRIGSHNLAHST